MNPYLQFFLGLPVFQYEAPFDVSTMTLFRKRIPVDLLANLNGFIAGHRKTLMLRTRTMIHPTAPRRMSCPGNRTKAQMRKRQVKRNSLPTVEH